MNTKHIFLTFAWLAACVPVISNAGAIKPDFGVEANTGYQYDSNVNVAEIDSNTGEADSALLLEAGLSAKLPLTDSLSFNLGYDFSQTSYREFTDFDLALHHGQAELAWRVAGFDTAVSADRFDARLGGEQFLEISQVSPSIARLFGNSFYLRAAFTRADKSYRQTSDRDATNDALRTDAYILFDGMNRYLSLGYQADDEDALDAELDYKGSRAMLGYGHRVELGRLKVDLKTRLQIEQRNYVSVTESIGAQRKDKRLRGGIAAAIPFAEHFELNAEAEYSENRSNFDTASFDEVVYSVNLGVEF